jgi:CIC family chloride channel protein
MVDPALQKDNTVKTVMVPPSAMVLENEPMHTVIKKFELTNSWILPVVDVNLVYKGFIMRNKIFEHYRNKVSKLKGDNKPTH